jgi:hypothetical protein
MAQDLSRVPARRQLQGRVTSNRDGLIPSRRDTDAAARQINQSLRFASRGDGAQQLAEIFGAVESSAKSLQGYVNDKHEADEVGFGVQGVRDFQAGTVDPELEAKSNAYAEAVTTGEAERSWFQRQGEIEAQIDERLNDPNHPASIAEIDDLIASNFQEFALDEGHPRDFGSAKANFTVARAMEASRTKILEQAHGIIRVQVEERSISTAASNLKEKAVRGAFNFEEALAQVVPGTDLKKTKAALIDTTQETATSLIDTDPDKALGLVDSLLASKRQDGTSSLAPNELESVRTFRRRLASEAEDAKATNQRREREATSDAFMDRLMRIPGTGSYPSATEIQQARASGKLEAEGARTLLNWIESDVREAEADRRARERSAGAPISGYPPSGSSIMAMVYEGRMSPQAAKGEIVRRAGLGEYGAGNDRRKAVSSMLSEISNLDAVHKGGFATATSAFQSEVISMRRDIRRLPAPQRKKAEQWIKTVQDAGVATIGAQMHKAGADGQRVGDAVSRSVVRDFLSAFPDLAQ